jgi:hypothetical protein
MLYGCPEYIVESIGIITVQTELFSIEKTIKFTFSSSEGD